MATRINNVVERFTLVGEDKSLSKTFKGASREVDSTHKSMAKLGTVLRRVAAGDVKGAKTAFGSLTQGMGGTALAATAVGTAIVAGMATAVVVITKVIAKYVELGKQVGMIGRITGMAGDESNSLRVQFKMLGLDVDASVKSLGKFGPSLFAARKGTGLQAEALAALGVSLKDSSGAWRSNADVLDEVRDKLSVLKKTDLAQYQGLSKAMFGKGFLTLDKWLAAAPAKIAKFQKIAATSTVNWDDKGLTQLLEDSRQVSTIWEDLQAGMGQNFAPLLKKFMKIAVESMPSMANSARDIAKALMPLAWLFDKIAKVENKAPWLKDAFMAIQMPAMNVGLVTGHIVDAFRVIRDLAREIAATIASIPATISSIITGLASIVMPKMPTLPNPLSGLKLPSSPLGLIPGLATGGYVAPRPGGTIVRVAERGEGEFVVPASKMTSKRGGGDIHVHNTFSGPVVGGAAGIRELTGIVQRSIMSGVMRGMVGQNA